jgi:hypothetical protein
MPLFGFYSDTQQRSCKVCIYENQYGRQVQVTDVRTMKDNSEAFKFYNDVYLKMFPDGYYIGELTKWISTRECGI